MIKEAMIVAAAIVIAGLLSAGRYSIVAPAEGRNVYRVDRWTGVVSICNGQLCANPK